MNTLNKFTQIIILILVLAIVAIGFVPLCFIILNGLGTSGDARTTITVITDFVALFVTFTLWKQYMWRSNAEPEKKRCRMCGTTEHPCIVYDKDMLCRKCFDDVIPYATKEKPNDFQI
jgi:ribosomal protein S14